MFKYTYIEQRRAKLFLAGKLRGISSVILNPTAR